MTHARLIPTVLLLAGLLSPVSAFPAAQDAPKAARAERRREVFAYLPSDRAKVAAPSSPAAVHEAKISVDVAALAPEVSSTLRLRLPDGEVYEAARTELERRGPDDLTWRGKIEGEDGQGRDVVLTARNGAVSGLIYTPEGLYQVFPLAGGEHSIARIDPSLFPPCDVDRKLTARQPAPTHKTLDAPASACDSERSIDVLVLYTASARRGAGGPAQIEATAQNAVDMANTAYANSRITPRLNLVGVAEVDYDDSGDIYDDLDWLGGDADVAFLRDAYGADVVSLLIEGGGAGLGYVMRDVGSDFESLAFSVVKRSLAVGNLTLAHEIGHNMGCEHNAEDSDTDPEDASFPWSYGHYVDGSFRTVMSYSDPCSSGCNRIAYFSNPAVLFAGQATGIANQRDNHRTINATAATVANFRCSLEDKVWFGNPNMSAVEGATATIAVHRTGNLRGELRVDYTTSSNSATSGSDFTAAAGTLTFADGEAQKSFTVTTTQDSSVEGNETLNLSLCCPENGRLGHNLQAVMTISDGDSRGIVEFSAINYAVGEATPTCTVTLTRSGGSAGQLTVALSSVTNTATIGTDVTGIASGWITWADGDAAPKTFTFNIANDVVDEGDESIALAIVGAGGDSTVVGTRRRSTLTIQDDDGLPPGVIFGAVSYSTSESGNAVVTLTRPSAALQQWVTLSTSNGSAFSGSDYTGTSVPVVFAVGQSTVSASIPILSDTVVEGNEFLNLTLSNPGNGAWLGSRRRAVLTIVDNDNAGTLAFQSANFFKSESGGQVTITVTRSNGTAGTVQVTCAVESNTALSGTDTGAVGPITLTFNNREVSKTFTVAIVDDELAEGSESLNLSLSAPTGGAVLGGSRRATLFIADDDIR